MDNQVIYRFVCSPFNSIQLPITDGPIIGPHKFVVRQRNVVVHECEGPEFTHHLGHIIWNLGEPICIECVRIVE